MFFVTNFCRNHQNNREGFLQSSLSTRFVARSRPRPWKIKICSSHRNVFFPISHIQPRLCDLSSRATWTIWHSWAWLGHNLGFMFPAAAQIAEELSHAESYNVLLTDFGSSQFFVKLLLLCEKQKIFWQKTQMSNFCRLKRFKFGLPSLATSLTGLVLKLAVLFCVWILLMLMDRPEFIFIISFNFS